MQKYSSCICETEEQVYMTAIAFRVIYLKSIRIQRYCFSDITGVSRKANSFLHSLQSQCSKVDT